MRKLVAVAALVVSLSARADFIDPGFFSSGFAVSGFFVEDGAGLVTVPLVIGEASAMDAQTIIEGVGLTFGTDTAVCSSATSGEVVSQSPAAGAMVAAASVVDVSTSSGVPCKGRPPLWLFLEVDR